MSPSVTHERAEPAAAPAGSGVAVGGLASFLGPVPGAVAFGWAAVWFVGAVASSCAEAGPSSWMACWSAAFLCGSAGAALAWVLGVWPARTLGPGLLGLAGLTGAAVLGAIAGPAAVALQFGLQAFGLGCAAGLVGAWGRGTSAGSASRHAAAPVAGAAAAVAAAMVWPATLQSLGGGLAQVAALGAAIVATGVAAWSRQDQGVRPPAVAGRRAFGGAMLGVFAVSLLGLGMPWGWWQSSVATPSMVVFGPALVATVLALVGGAGRLAVCAAAVGALLAWVLSGAHAAASSPGHRLLATSGPFRATYGRATQELQLWCGDQLVDAAGPDRPQAEFAAVLLAACLSAGDRVLVLGLGAGRLPAALARAGIREVDVADPAPAAFLLLPRLQNDGPVQTGAGVDAVLPAGVRRRVVGLRAALVSLPYASRQAVVLGEPLHAGSSLQVRVELQCELRRVAGAGLVVQPFAVDRTPPSMLRALFGAAVVAHPWNAVFAVGECGLLLSAARPPEWARLQPITAWPTAARWLAHAAHVGEIADLQRACLGTVGEQAAEFALGELDPPPMPSPGGRAGLVPVLHELLLPIPALPPPGPEATLLRWMALQAEVRRTAAAIRALADGTGAPDQAQSLAAAFLHVGAPGPILQAALALPAADGIRLRDPAAASLCAHAIDPTFFDALPPLFSSLPRPRQATGELEDFAALPNPDRLVELCVGDAPLAVALRTRFGSRCAQALVAKLAAGPLPAAANQALRELADPFVLAEAGRVLQPLGRSRELLALWRGDLPLPAALAGLAVGDAADGRLLAQALSGRKDSGSLQVLATMLESPDLAVRQAAGASLATTVGDRIPYDATWPRSALIEAADRVRSLHNRGP